MSEISSSAWAWTAQESSTKQPDSPSVDYNEPTDYAPRDTWTEPQQTYSGAWYGTETTRNLWNRISKEAHSDTSTEISLSYQEALTYLEGNS